MNTKKFLELPEDGCFGFLRRLEETNCEVPMSPVKEPISDNLCETCIKQDVCMYKEQCALAVREIMQITDKTNGLLTATIKCVRWSK